MYLALSLALVLAFCAVTVLLPFRFPLRLRAALALLRRRLVGHPEIIEFGNVSASQEDREQLLLRLWGAGAALLFVACGVLDGALLLNRPTAIVTTGGYAALAIGVAGLGMAAWLAAQSLLPRICAEESMRRHGFEALWPIDHRVPNERLRATLAVRTRESDSIAITDVTGYEILGKGPGEKGGLLYDAIAQAPLTPVSIVLCKPDANAVDPERRKSSVLQNLLAELNISQSTYVRRVHATMDAVCALNEGREPNARIQVRFYGEKPTLRSVVFDGSCLAMPWHPREDRGEASFVDIANKAECVTFYETFRRHFARLWGSHVGNARSATGSTTAARSRPSNAVSESFALKPAKPGVRAVKTLEMEVDTQA